MHALSMCKSAQYISDEKEFSIEDFDKSGGIGRGNPGMRVALSICNFR
jgi:hypothetical protein